MIYSQCVSLVSVELLAGTGDCWPAQADAPVHQMHEQEHTEPESHYQEDYPWGRFW